MASLRRRLSVAVGFGETHFACRKHLCSQWLQPSGFTQNVQRTQGIVSGQDVMLQSLGVITSHSPDDNPVDDQAQRAGGTGTASAGGQCALEQGAVDGQGCLGPSASSRPSQAYKIRGKPGEFSPITVRTAEPDMVQICR